MTFAAIREFLKLQGIHYQAPAKAGVLALEMEQYRALAQAARKLSLIHIFQEIYQSVDSYREAVAQQIAQSSSVEPAVFKARLQEGIGGHSE